ncbi:hypothetical protein T459_20577 [Capsicum annuum]|uniref:Glycosyltransferase N-terminal domain-containing protein n=1 Tax=Capsicum annuum TaxID=4072 RepID=A0A2G2Z5C5_CAPAN|nr:hypothetical protein T459_20577 [Capsicum annuum]
MEAKKKTISVLMLPWLAHGHTSPYLELAKKLADRDFHIYLCSTPINLNYSVKQSVIEKYSQSIELVELHLPSFPNRPPRYHTTNGLPSHLMRTLKDAFKMAAPKFSEILQALNPDLVIYDYNQPWAADFASSLNIPAVVFIIYSVATVSWIVHLFENIEEKFLFPEIYLREYEMLPIMKNIDEIPDHEKFTLSDTLRRSRDIVLVKAYRDFEGKYMDYLSNIFSKKIVPLGSLVQQSIDQDDHEEIKQWLDLKEKSSTIFFSFGSFHKAKILVCKMHYRKGISEKAVEYIGAAVEAGRDKDGNLQSEEIAKAIRKVVASEESGEAVRKKVKKLSEMMTAKGDEEIMDGVAQELVALCRKK